MRPFPVNVISKNRVPLLIYHRNQWKGSLEKELPGIFNWAMASTEDEARNFLVSTAEFVPSLVKELDEAKYTFDPIGLWIKEELDPGEGSYVGFKTKTGPKGELENQRRRTLYGAYEVWCGKRRMTPYGYKAFTDNLINSLHSSGYEPRLIRKTPGMYIIRLKGMFRWMEYTRTPLITSLPLRWNYSKWSFS